MQGNNGTVKWVSIIVAIIIAMSGISFGVIRTSNREEINKLEDRVARQQKTIQQSRENEIRLDMRLSNIEEQTADINKKIDILLKR